MTNWCLPAALLGCLALFSPLCSRAEIPSIKPVEGLGDNTPQNYALTGGTVHVGAGTVLENATIIIRDGSITRVGTDIEPPADVRRVDLAGKMVYPGFIDAYRGIELDSGAAKQGGSHWNPYIVPQLGVARDAKLDRSKDEQLRAAGITAQLVAPQAGIIKGTSALVLTADVAHPSGIVHTSLAQHVRLTVPFGRNRDQYPNSPMGAVALARQTLLDADWYGRAWRAFRGNRTLPRPEHDVALEALQPYLDGEHLVIVDAANELYALRADAFAREFGLKIALRGSGNEYRRLAKIQQTGRPLILPVDFPKPPNVATPELALNATLEAQMHWYLAVENPGRVAAAGIPFAFTTDGLKSPNEFLKAIRKAVKRGLSAEQALAALTTTPAEMFGVSDLVGTIAAGKIANLVVASGDLFAGEGKIVATWVDGREFEIEETTPLDFRGSWELAFANRAADEPATTLTVELGGKATKLTGKVVGDEADSVPAESEEDDEASAEEDSDKEQSTKEKQSQDKSQAKKRKISQISVRGARWTGQLDAEALGGTGVARLSAVVSTTGEGLAMQGYVLLPDGSRRDFSGTRTKLPDDLSDKQAGDESKENGESSPTEDDAEEKDDDPIDVAVNFPLGAYGREGKLPAQPEVVVFRGATVWTCSEQGIIDNAAVVVRQGRIEQVGSSATVATPEGAIVVDVTGKHISPGIIDCHSHMATDGGVNESGQAVTAEVRIGDFIDCDDINIYRQLAGGVTSSNILHGSANPIGGQNQVIKLRWGATPEAMKFAEAPPGIKFALGENVKQSNWGEKYMTRYPQTRMGVEQIFVDRFFAARDYRRRWENWRNDHEGLPPRRDLETEAIAEIVAGDRWIHCHSYRQDEILALLRVLERFSITIGTFQHILEGYKVAPEMAAHGAMGSAFSDWWAYKFEVYDAIPYNGALMHQAGVVVSFNSDDQELARHLNHEAAKAVKYGGVPPEEALKFVTLNPARQLRIDPWVGSLEAGKHADLVVWSGPPMSTLARCEQTWIDGRNYFSREQDKSLRQRDQKLRNALVQKILGSGEPAAKPGDNREDPSAFWPRHDEYCHAHGHDHRHANQQ